MKQVKFKDLTEAQLKRVGTIVKFKSNLLSKVYIEEDEQGTRVHVKDRLWVSIILIAISPIFYALVSIATMLKEIVVSTIADIKSIANGSSGQSVYVINPDQYQKDSE